MTEPLLGNLGCLADTGAAQAILDGAHTTPDNLNPHAKLLMQQLATPSEVTAGLTSSREVTMESHMAGWKKQDE